MHHTLLYAEKLIAEIERRRSEAEKTFNHIFEYASSAKEISEWVSREYNNILSYIDSLQQEQPSLPSDIDKAAEEYSENILANNEDLQDAIEDAFKEGAKWMARQGVTLNLSIDELSCGAYNSCVEQGLTSEDDVIIQIRKKQ